MVVPHGPALRAEHSRLLLELSRHIVSTLDLQDVLARAMDSLRRVIPFQGGLIRLLEDGYLLTAANDLADAGDLEVRIPADQGLAGSVLRSIEPIYVQDLTAAQMSDPSIRALSEAGALRSYLGLALADGEGFLGTVELGSPERNAFSRDQVAAAIELAPSIAIAIRNAGAASSKVAAEPVGAAQVLDQDFISLVAHELRTPLAVVLGCAETMAVKAEELDPAVVRDLSQRAVSAGHRLERLIADLFDMSRIRSGSLSVTPVPTSVRSIISRAVEDAPQTLHMTTRIEDRIPLADVDPNRLVQILRILLDNAWKHAGEHAEVDIRARPDGGVIVLEIADSGPGIVPGVIDKVFEPFVQAEEPMTRSVGGLGIGLFLAKGICDLMHASIDVASEPGGGTTFTIRLPAAVMAEASPEARDDNDPLEPAR
ncbi:MAG: ATP-binding protein [Actinomycetota bacterium]|nr:ATP-binding protein [Actinomycetota bacterium]